MSRHSAAPVPAAASAAPASAAPASTITIPPITIPPINFPPITIPPINFPPVSPVNIPPITAPGVVPEPPREVPPDEVMKREHNNRHLKSLANGAMWSTLGSTLLNGLCTGLTGFSTIQHYRSSRNLSKLDPKNPQFQDIYEGEEERTRQAIEFFKGAAGVASANAAHKVISSNVAAKQMRELKKYD